LAYTVTNKSGAATVVGTSSNDLLAADTDISKSVVLNSYEGNDSVVLSGGVSSGTIGMGGGVDTVTLTTTKTKALNITLGDSTDFFISALADDGITVGGQGGADTFTLGSSSVESVNSRYAGGQGKDSFTGYADSKTTIVGGSEVDTINMTKLGSSSFVNGQKGKDDIDLVLDGTKATVYGGSEDDTINNTGTTSSNLLSGDKGADKIVDASGANTINGGGGKDTIVGGIGSDTTNGGLGVDRFELASGTATGSSDTNGDGGLFLDAASEGEVAVIGDFNVGGTLYAVSTGMEIISDFESTDKIKTANGTSAVNATDAAALAIGNTYFAYGNYRSDGAFVVAASGSDAIVFFGADAADGAATSTDNYHGLAGTNWLVVQGGASNLTSSSFVA